jgi:hypothetical protein
MSRIIDAEPYTDAVVNQPPPPPARIEVSVEEAMERVEEATRIARAAALAENATTDPNVIRVEPRLGEISVLDMMQRARPYIVGLLLLAALFIIGRMLWELRRQYRMENIVDVTARPMDRRSVARERRKKE